MDGLIRAAPDPGYFSMLAEQWFTTVSRVGGEGMFKPLGFGAFLDLSDDRDAPLQRIPGGFRAGRVALVEFLEHAMEAGVNHFALNPKVSRRPYLELMEELATDVLPLFPSH